MKKELVGIFVFVHLTVMMLCANSVLAAGNSVAPNTDSVIEAESFTWYANSSRDSDDASGDRFICWDSGIAAAEQTITITVDRTGFYCMKVVAGAAGANDAYSTLTFDVNNETKTIGAGDIDATGVSFNGYAGLPLKTFTVYDNIYLEQGDCSVEITIGARPGYPSNILAQIDAFIFSPSDAIPNVENREALIEVEAFDSQNNRNIEAASGQKTVAFYDYDNEETEYSITTYVNAPQQGEYKISVNAAADDGASAVLSYLDIILNDGESIRLNSTNCDITVLGFDGWRADLNDHPVKSFKYKDSIILNEGLNKIEVVLSENSSRGTIFGAVDCIKIRGVVDLSGITVHDLIVAVGETSNIILTNSDGESVDAGDFESLEVVATDGNVAKTEGVAVTGYNLGETAFTLTYDTGENEGTLSGIIRVVGEKGLYIENIVRNGVQLTANVVASESFVSDGSCVLVAVYGKVDNKQTSLKQVIPVEIPSLASGERRVMSVTMTEPDVGDVIATYIVDSTLTLSQYGKIVVE